MTTFGIQNNDFCLDGQTFRVLSGAMHYFRVHPDYWADRMQKMKMMGLNTLETYVAWNMHEPKQGQFVFDEWMDIEKYIKTAHEVGLKVIVRPGPYMCSEWDLGGLPAWLLKDPQMKLRCNYKPYLDAVDNFFKQLLPRLVPLQITKGGPIIAMQIENEYGSYGNDKIYLTHLETQIRASGIDILLFTSDGATDEMLQCGTLPHILKTANFGSQATSQFKKLREYQPTGPLLCGEFWNGWFDHWGEEQHTRAAQDAAETLDEILSQDASVNCYMFHGGTNFGFENGANYDTKYRPTITSYDSNAPLNEQGDITPKFHAYCKVIAKYSSLPDIAFPDTTPTMAIKPFQLTESVNLLDSLNELTHPITRPTPEPMECFDQSHGFILYQTQISGPRSEAPLTIHRLHDRAHVFVNDQFIGTLEREFPERTLNLTISQKSVTLKILVENMGRVNYGSHLADRKGITDFVILGAQILYNWTIFPLPLDNLTKLNFTSPSSSACPTFYRGYFNVESPQDSFLYTQDWSKGVCWINGFNLGRYWKRGPQQTLYVPKPLFQTGKNDIILLELDQHNPQKTLEFLDQPILNKTTAY